MPIPENCSILGLPLETERLTLKSLVPDDFDDLFMLCTHPDICRYIRPPMSREQVAQHIEDRLQPWHMEEMKWYSLAVRQRGKSRMIGEMVFRLESVDHSRAEIGYRFHPDVAGMGFATEASRAVVELLLNKMGLHKLSAYSHADNSQSRALLERLGMQLEGRRREDMFSDGAWYDLCIYGMLHHEYLP